MARTGDRSRINTLSVVLSAVFLISVAISIAHSHDGGYGRGKSDGHSGHGCAVCYAADKSVADHIEQAPLAAAVEPRELPQSLSVDSAQRVDHFRADRPRGPPESF